jgi:hypothetical protein
MCMSIEGLQWSRSCVHRSSKHPKYHQCPAFGGAFARHRVQALPPRRLRHSASVDRSRGAIRGPRIYLSAGMQATYVVCRREHGVDHAPSSARQSEGPLLNSCPPCPLPCRVSAQQRRLPVESRPFPRVRCLCCLSRKDTPFAFQSASCGS